MKDVVDKLSEYHYYAETPSERKTFSAAIEEILYLRNEQKKYLSRKSDTQGMNDIVERLRNTAEIGVPDFTNSKILQEAADKIELLRDVMKRLIEDHEYMTDTDAEEDNLARAAAREAIRESRKDG